ncbi:MAG: toxin-antitoxin system YwqK family antitoxin [Bacteroidales bacterium]|nr:toxin-antitoxin system YwqK family antitoxin [Bacteroidales bacterium]MBN2817666.1 toxin-antitoxin system YwqK family antitoxin [Bacteroidales bacterium]
MRLILTLIIIFQSVTGLLGQTDTVFNQLDEMGMKQGYWKKYYPNGKLMYKGFFKDNKPDGEMRRYYENGTLQAVITVLKYPDYVFTKLFYEDGEISAEGFFNGTLKDSTWKYYSFYSGTIISEENYHNGTKNGIQKTYYQTGKLSEEIEYKNDIKDGIWNQFFEDGTKKLEAHNRWNMANGRYTFYHPNGVIYMLGNFADNKKHGSWIFYDTDGKEKYRLHYDYGILDSEDEKMLIKQDQEFFKMVDENIGKFEDPSIEDFYRTPF